MIHLGTILIFDIVVHVIVNIITSVTYDNDYEIKPAFPYATATTGEVRRSVAAQLKGKWR